MEKEYYVLIDKAKEAIHKSAPVNLKDTGDVGCALITKKGNRYTGVSLGFMSGIGSCGEYQAIGNMISNGEKEIDTIVAIWFNEKKNTYEIIPPCGKCREMIHQISKKNWEANVIISEKKIVKLKDLLPFAWDGTIEKKRGK